MKKNNHIFYKKLMIINENRGSYGMFSRAGKSSNEKFHILMKKDEILNGANGKSKLPDLYGTKEESEPEDNYYDNFGDENEIFTKDKKAGLNKKNFKINTKPKKDKDALEKFERIMDKNKRMNETPNFNKYNPRNEYIWKKIVTNQYWDRSIKKNFSIKEKEEIKAKYYISHDVEGKNIRGFNYIDIAKQTKRPTFMNLKTVEKEEFERPSDRKVFSSERSSTSNNFFNAKAKTSMNFYKSNSGSNSFQNSPSKNDVYNNSNGFMNTQDNSNSGNNFNMNYSNNYDPKRETAYSFNNNIYRTSFFSSSNFKKDKKKWFKIQAPDFKRMGSRENKNLKTDNKRIIPFGLPSLNGIIESKKC